MAKLAIKGGKKFRSKLFPYSNSLGKAEQAAVKRVLDTGVLSKFLASWLPEFYGGPEVQALEKEWAKYFGVKHALVVNSATSGLYCAVGATGVNPGEEIIVSPTTMSASAVAPLVYSAIPVFADIERDYFCLDPKSVEARITKKTRAIIVVDIYGLPYDAARINAIAKKHKLYVIEDCAQGPYAKYGKKFAGTLGDIGVYSLNYHKHIHTGEGGIVVTDNDELADRVRLIRNHAESVVQNKGQKNLVNLVGFNFRMTEIEAAIGREQLKKLKVLAQKRAANVAYLEKHLAKIPCLQPAKVRPVCEHVYYVQPLKFDSGIAGVHRDKFVAAVKAELPAIEKREKEGVKIFSGGYQPVHLLPLFQKKIAMGKFGHPWSTFKSKVSYKKGICPVAEDLYENVLITHELIGPAFTKKDLDDVVKAFKKVWENRNELRTHF